MKSKSILKSKTFWGAVVSALPTVLQVAGVATGPAGLIVNAAGAALAIYGRVAARAPVHVVRP